MSAAAKTTTPASTLHDWVLVVDDDAPITLLMCQALTTAEVEVVSAASGLEALKEIGRRDTEPVMVVTDVLMPGMDGLTLTRKLTVRLKRSKIIVMSGHLSDASFWPEDLREVTFLTKPFSMAVLNELLEIARSEFHQKP